MVKIDKILVLVDYKIKFWFSDSSQKVIGFKEFIGTDELTAPLSEKSYFEKVTLYDDKRRIYWPNGFDFCPDFSRFHAEETKSNTA